MSNHPYWDKIINHVAGNSVTRAQGIKSWLSALILRPTNVLETMVLFGDEMSGKSTFLCAVKLIPVATPLVTCDEGVMFRLPGSHAIVVQQKAPEVLGHVFSLPMSTIEKRDYIAYDVIKDNLLTEMPAFMRTLLDVK